MKQTLTARKAGRTVLDENGKIIEQSGGTHRGPVQKDVKPQPKKQEKGNANQA